MSERGTNFQYIPDEQKAQLPVFFSWFKNFPVKVLQTFEARIGSQSSYENVNIKFNKKI